MDISNKTFVVVGTGKSGVAAAELLLRHAKKFIYMMETKHLMWQLFVSNIKVLMQ